MTKLMYNVRTDGNQKDGDGLHYSKQTREIMDVEKLASLIGWLVMGCQTVSLTSSEGETCIVGRSKVEGDSAEEIICFREIDSVEEIDQA